MFKITGHKDNVTIKECVASTVVELPDEDQCKDYGVSLGSEVLVIATSDVYILDDDYEWKKI